MHLNRAFLVVSFLFLLHSTHAQTPDPNDDYLRYGSILKPGGTPDHPVVLDIPATLSTEVNLPSADALQCRIQLEKLARLSDAEIRLELEKWPPYGRLSLGDQGRFLVRLQEFRDRRNQAALKKASELGLNTLTPAQQITFQRRYWELRLAADEELVKQFRPLYDAQENKLSQTLFHEFSGMTPAGATANK